MLLGMLANCPQKSMFRLFAINNTQSIKQQYGVEKGHCAGRYNLLISLAAVWYFGFHRKLVDLAWIYDNFLPLLSAAVSFTFLLSLGLYLASFRRYSMHYCKCWSKLAFQASFALSASASSPAFED